jgi:putative PIN family toxin of toxin-antitoxin system
MTTPPKVVVDTSVHVSAAKSKSDASSSREVLRRGNQGHFEFAVSVRLLSQIYYKLVFQCRYEPADAQEYISALSRIGRMHRDKDIDDKVWCRDDTDLFVLMLALVSEAWRLVAGDRDLLDPDAWKCPGLETRPPGTFLADLRALRGENL